MKEIITSIEINASPETVWSILSDFESYPDWNPFVVSIEGDLAPGGKLKTKIALPGRKPMMFRPQITSLMPLKVFSWLGRFLIPGLFDGEHFFEIEELGEGRLRLVHREEFSGILVPLLWRSLERPTRSGFELMNQALKNRSESKINSKMASNA